MEYDVITNCDDIADKAAKISLAFTEHVVVQLSSIRR